MLVWLEGFVVFQKKFWVFHTDEELFTDSSARRGNGFGIYFSGEWTLFYKGYTTDITVLEFFPLLVSVLIWGEKVRNKKVLFRSDNQSVVHIVNSMTSKSDLVMTLLRKFVLKCLQLNISFKAQHVFGCQNSLTDSLSRLQFQRFYKLAQDADSEPTPFPAMLCSIFETKSLDY